MHSVFDRGFAPYGTGWACHPPFRRQSRVDHGGGSRLGTGATLSAYPRADMARAAGTTRWPIAYAAENGDDPFLIPLDAWDQHLEEEPATLDFWRKRELRLATSHRPGQPVGTTFPENEDLELSVVRTGTVDGLGWVTLLGSLVVLRWKARRNWRLIGSSRHFWVVAALVVPESLFSFARRGLLGTFGRRGIDLGDAIGKEPSEAADPSRSARVAVPETRPVGAGIVGTCRHVNWFFLHAVLAAEPDPLGPPPRQATYQSSFPLMTNSSPSVTVLRA